MGSMTVDTISAYRLRKDKLLEYLRKVFPNDSLYLTAELSDGNVYTLKVPRALKQEEKTHIFENLREEEE